MKRTRKTDRREFIQRSAIASAGFWVAGTAERAPARSASDELHFACIGVGGKGRTDSRNANANGNIVAICDIDEKRLDESAAKYPKAKKYTDFRKLLDEMHQSIDAVTVTTPDHTHAVAAVMAMKMGKHCYCQKPLTHSIYEARVMREVAEKHNVATQMGNQGTALDRLRDAVALLREGVIGPVRKVHVWTNRPGKYWKNGLARPTETPAVPKHVHWDQFLGRAAYRPYHPTYHPHDWRAWWDFGTGALGDMGCHTMNMPVMALELFDPVSVEATTSGHNKDSYPLQSVVTYQFPATEKRPAVELTWYDGGKLPPKELFHGEKIVTSGSLSIGDGGSLYSPNDYSADYVLFPKALGKPKPKNPLPKLKNPSEEGHFAELADAIRGGPTPMSNFDYAGRLTETVLLGNLAVWSGKKIEWDAANMVAKGAPELDALIKPAMRNGYTL